MGLTERLNEVFKNVKQKHIAERLEISQGAVSDLLKGNKKPSSNTLIKICEEFDVDGHWLLTGTGTDCLTDEERKVIMGYRKCTEKEKGRIEEIIDSSEGNR